MSVVIDGTTGVSGADGSAATPALRGEDANTGVFFPAADTVAVATAGAERLRVASAGQIGIGGANYGTSGQVLVSGGAGAAPSWTVLPDAGIGFGQTWQDVLASRTPGVSYQNTTGKPIMVAIDHFTSSGGPTVQVSVNNSTWITIHTMTGGSVRVGTQFIVPNNWYYRVSSGPVYSNWTELR